MFLGHYGVALGAKRAAPKLSLGWTVLAAQWVDLIWPIFLLLGIEHVRIIPGITKVTPLDFYDYPLTHSLLGTVVWGILLGGLMLVLRKGTRAALVVGLCVVSHWFLDLVVHRPDLLLVPGGSTYVGFGLWNSLPATLLVEFAVFGLGAAIYLRSTTAKDRIGSFGIIAFLAFLAVVCVGNFFSPPPPNSKALAVSALSLWLMPPWAAWVDRHRSPRKG